MGADTAIAWCHHTFNPWIGCTKVSPGCANCYAESYDKRVGGGINSDGVKRLRWGVGAERVRTSPAYWKQPLAWNRAAEKAGVRKRVFCASLADVFDADVDDVWRVELFDLIRRTPALDWLLLTKRPEGISTLRTRAIDAYVRAAEATMETADMLQAWVDGTPPGNVWLGVTVEDQEQADKRIPLLLAHPAKERFLSCEPLLGSLDLTYWLDEDANGFEWRVGQALQWVIVGGESGPKARPFSLDWARSLVAQCRDAGVAPFVKQLGARPESSSQDDKRHCGDTMLPSPFRMRLQDRAGADPSEWPEDLRVRKFPEVTP